ncbi:HAD family hydrolase [soil metagenome]
MTAFDAVIFDCDGVLVDSEILAIEVEIALLRDEGLHYEPEEFHDRFIGLHDTAFRDALEADCRARLGAPLRADFLELTHQHRHDACRARLLEVAGAGAALTALTLPKAVASSSGQAFLREKLEMTGLVGHFGPHVYSADLVARGKPHPDIFLYAADRLGVAPDRCVALEDSANGVASARAAGMTVWGFTGGSHCGDGQASRLLNAGAHEIVASWAKAQALFR